jgi:hypothetical protein
MRKSRTYKKGGIWGKPTPPPPQDFWSQGKSLLNDRANQYLQNNPNTQMAVNYARGATKNPGALRTAASLLSNSAKMGYYGAKMGYHGARLGLSAAKLGAKIGYRSVNNPVTRGIARTAVRQALKGGITRKKKRGGNVVRAFNTYNDSFTMHAKPVSGYNTAVPHNWVGGRTRRRR